MMYDYVNLQGRPSINKKNSMIRAAYILYKFKPLIPRKQKRWKSVIKYLMLFRKNKISGNIRSLPINGDLALEVNSINHKVFNLKQGIVYTIYNQNYKEYIDKQFSLINSHDMYEKIISLDGDNRVIKSKFYNGYHPNFNHNSSKNIIRLSRLFYELIIRAEAKQVNATEYAHSLNMDIMDGLDCIFKEQKDKKIIESVRHIAFQKYHNFLEKNKSNKIHLVVTHGDIKHENLIEKRGEFIPIDWEFSEFRSPVFDLIKFMFRENYDTYFYERVLEQTTKKFINQDYLYYFNNIWEIYIELYSLEYIKHRILQFKQRYSMDELNNVMIPLITNLEYIERYITDKNIGENLLETPFR